MIEMIITIRSENNALFIKHNFVVGVLYYTSIYESWMLEHFGLKINGIVDLNKYEIKFLITNNIGIDAVATAFKLEFG